jgi:arylformamidase
MNINKIIYLSHPYNDSTPSYGDRDQVEISPNSSIQSGETANSSRWVFTNNHIGTHVDVPYHFDLSGKEILDYAPREWIFNKVGLVDIHCEEAHLIEAQDLLDDSIDSDIELLLIRTGFERYRGGEKYWKDNPGISSKLPEYLRKQFPQLRCVGFDFISITSWRHRDIGRESHLAFLKPPENQCPLLAIEDMSLNNINGNIDWAIVSPLLIQNGNGSPVTVFANLKG